MKAVVWLGNSKKNVMKWPVGAKDQAVFQLERIRHGLDPTEWKPMKAVGKGMREICIREQGDQYCIIYIAARTDGIYVLHAFQKKSQKTPKQETKLARQRMQSIAKLRGQDE